MFKSKLGMFLAGIYLIVLFYALIEANTPPPEPKDGFALLILTAPCSFLLGILLDNLLITTKENSDSLLYVYIASGGLINASILYLVGWLSAKIFGTHPSKERF